MGNSIVTMEMMMFGGTKTPLVSPGWDCFLTVFNQRFLFFRLVGEHTLSIWSGRFTFFTAPMLIQYCWSLLDLFRTRAFTLIPYLGFLVCLSRKQAKHGGQENLDKDGSAETIHQPTKTNNPSGSFCSVTVWSSSSRHHPLLSSFFGGSLRCKEVCLKSKQKNRPPPQSGSESWRSAWSFPDLMRK